MGRNGDQGALFVACSRYRNRYVQIPHHCGFPVMMVVRGHGNDARGDLLLRSVHANLSPRTHWTTIQHKSIHKDVHRNTHTQRHQSEYIFTYLHLAEGLFERIVEVRECCQMGQTKKSQNTALSRIALHNITSVLRENNIHLYELYAAKRHVWVTVWRHYDLVHKAIKRQELRS